MALLLTYPQITSLTKGQEISGLRGKVKLAWPQQETPPREEGGLPGFKQGVVVTMPGGEVIVSLYDRDPLVPEAIKGQDIVVTPGVDGRGKVGGITYSPYARRDGKTDHYINVRKNAEVTIGAGKPAAPGTPPRTAPSGGHSRWSTFLPAQGMIVDAAFDEALKICRNLQEDVGALCGTGFTTEDVRCISNALIIAGEKHGLPVPPPQAAPPKPTPPPPPPAPEPEPEPEPENDPHASDNDGFDPVPF